MSLYNSQPVLEPKILLTAAAAPSKNPQTPQHSSVALLALGRPSFSPLASTAHSAIPIFRPFAAPLSPCLTPSALFEEGSQALGFDKTIHDDINKSQYDCLVCTEGVRPVSRIWSCQICSRVLHLSCVRRWARAELSSERFLKMMDGWRCPACNEAQIKTPAKYTCWCGKQVKPRLLPGLPHYSCGRACSRVSVGKSCCDRPCEFICHAGPCPPCGYKEPPQQISDESLEDKSRHSRSKRRFGEIDESIITHPNDIRKTRILFHIDCANDLVDSAITIEDNEEEPQLKKHKGVTTLRINHLIRKTKGERAEVERALNRISEAGMDFFNKPSKELYNQLQRRLKCLVDARRHILDHNIESIASGDTTLCAIDDLITKNEGQMAEVMQEFHQVHKGGVSASMDHRSTALWDKHLSLERRHQRLMETRMYLDAGFASEGSSRGLSALADSKTLNPCPSGKGFRTGGSEMGGRGE